MENLTIEATEYKPRIDFNASSGILEVSKNSYGEYTLEFFKPVFEWLKEYTQEEGKKVELNFKMTYFNTSTSRRFLEILNILEDYYENKGGEVNVNWYYDENDMDMLEQGEDYLEDVSLPLNLIPL